MSKVKGEQMLEKAKQIAREVHKGQKRWDGKPYIIHPEAVAENCYNNDCKIVAWLHDVLEDTDLQPEELEEKGIPKYLVQCINCLTKFEGEDYIDYILRIKKNNRITILVKIEDIRNNLINLKKGSMRDKYLLSLHILEDN